MATIPKQPVSIAHTRGGGPAYVRSYPEAASQTFKKGAFVLLTAGKVTLCGDDPAVVLGVAMHDASGVVDTPVMVAEANSETIFVGNVAVSQTTAITQVGVRYGTKLDGTNFHVNTADTTAPTVVVVALDPRDTVADTNGRVYFNFLATATQTAILA